MINWKIMEQHAENYDGTCSYCGGKCKCRKAIDEKIKVYEIIHRMERDNDAKGLAYYRRRIARTYTYKVII